MNEFVLAASLKPFIAISAVTTVSEALAQLRQSGVSYCIVGDAQRPQALAHTDSLAALADVTGQPLAQVQERLPSLLVIDQVPSFDTEELKLLGRLLYETKAPGLVVYHDNTVVGIIPRGLVSAALSLSSIPSPSSERGLGTPNIPTRTFICRKCTPLQTRRRVSRGDEVPDCPRDWLHGPMERE